MTAYKRAVADPIDQDPSTHKFSLVGRRATCVLQYPLHHVDIRRDRNSRRPQRVLERREVQGQIGFLFKHAAYRLICPST